MCKVKVLVEMPNQRSYKHICKKNADPGYVLDREIFALIKDRTITKAVEKVSEKIKKCIEDIKRGWGRSIEELYIGKTYISEKYDDFDAENPKTWGKEGISARYTPNRKNGYSWNGFIVVGVVTEKSIPLSCKEGGYITHHEEYALTLEKCLIEHFREDSELGAKIANKLVYHPGRRGMKKRPAYTIYIKFSMEGKQ